MRTSGRGQSERAMILIPALVLFFMIMVITGGPTQFIRLVNFELRQISSALGSWVTLWF